jgi:hypothetical protein
MHRIGVVVALALLAGCESGSGENPEKRTREEQDGFAPVALARMQTLAGTWKAEVRVEPSATDAKHPDDASAHSPAAEPSVTSPAPEPIPVEYRIADGGHALQEKLFAGSDHEIVTTYYLEGMELALLHGGAMGKRPHMQLDRKSSTRDDLHFAWDGRATDLDPKKDTHLHEGRVHFVDADTIECEWAQWVDGKEASRHRFTLRRGVGKFTPAPR